MSIRPGSQASIRVCSAGRAPSIQMLSMLATKIGSRPSSGAALAIPPPESSRPARSSEISTRGLVRRRRCASIWSAKWWTLTTAVSTPASASRSRMWSIRARPATSTSALGRVSVKGRMRVPSPAARTMAVFGPLVMRAPTAGRSYRTSGAGPPFRAPPDRAPGSARCAA